MYIVCRIHGLIQIACTRARAHTHTCTHAEFAAPWLPGLALGLARTWARSHLAPTRRNDRSLDEGSRPDLRPPRRDGLRKRVFGAMGSNAPGYNHRGADQGSPGLVVTSSHRNRPLCRAGSPWIGQFKTSPSCTWQNVATECRTSPSCTWYNEATEIFGGSGAHPDGRKLAV